MRAFGVLRQRYGRIWNPYRGTRGFSEKLYFAPTHEWFRVKSDKLTGTVKINTLTLKIATVGVSDFAQKELGKIVYVDIPEPPFAVLNG